MVAAMINDKDVDQYVARQLKALRLTMGLSQGQVAEQLDVTFQQVQKYENGVNRISAGRAMQFAEMFDVSVLALFPELDYKPHEPIPPATVRLLRMINRISPRHYGDLYVVMKAMAKLSTGDSGEE